MRTSLVLAVIRQTLRQTERTSRRAALVISAELWFVPPSKRRLIALVSVMEVTMRPRNWRVLPVTRSGQVCRVGGKCRRLCLSIITHRLVLPVAPLATTGSAPLAETTLLRASAVTRVRHGTFDIFESLWKVSQRCAQKRA